MCAYLGWKGDGCLHFRNIRGLKAGRSNFNAVDFEKGKANSEVFMIIAICKSALASAYLEKVEHDFTLTARRRHD